MTAATQLSFFGSAELSQQVAAFIRSLIDNAAQPSALELITAVEKKCGLLARWDLLEVVSALAQDSDLTFANRAYLASLLETGDLEEALRGPADPESAALSTIDTLLRESAIYRQSGTFQEMVDFMGRFKDYSPYNNMLVRLQNPSCGFYATEKDWRTRFRRSLRDDARPLIILAPMHPVLLAYPLDQTEGPELQLFAQFSGAWQSKWLAKAIQNAERYKISVEFRSLSTTNAGFAQRVFGKKGWKYRVVIHENLNEPSRFGVLCHELAHIFLGHFGTDEDRWWPARSNLTQNVIEIEAEAVAHIVSTQLGLVGSSAAYISRYLQRGGVVPSGVSLDSIAKAAGLIARAARENVYPSRAKERRVTRRAKASGTRTRVG